MTTGQQKTDKWLDRKLERRTLLKKAAIGGASLAVLYVAPKFTSAGSRPAYAAITGGCTPGFWKTDTPSTEWPSVASGAPQPGDQYDSTFTAAASWSNLTGKTFLSVLGQGGGCEKALGRHSAAALLNAYAGIAGFDVASIVTATNLALTTSFTDGNCVAIEAQKNIFESLNEGSCSAGGRLPDETLFDAETP